MLHQCFCRSLYHPQTCLAWLSKTKWCVAPFTLSLRHTHTQSLLRPPLTIKQNNHSSLCFETPFKGGTNKFYLFFISPPPSSFQLSGSELSTPSGTSAHVLFPDERIFTAVAANLWRKKKKEVSLSASCWCRHARAIFFPHALTVSGYSTHVSPFNHLHRTVWGATVWLSCFLGCFCFCFFVIVARGALPQDSRLTAITALNVPISAPPREDRISQVTWTHLSQTRHHIIIRQTTVNGCL